GAKYQLFRVAVLPWVDSAAVRDGKTGASTLRQPVRRFTMPEQKKHHWNMRWTWCADERRVLAGAGPGGLKSYRLQGDLAVLVLGQQVAEVARSAGVAGLRAEGAQRHVVAGFDLDPVVVQTVDGLAFQHVQAVLHDVGFGERDGCTRLEG